ncbi:MAG TPA: FG-GAP-like repeat-containing protein [bacterium]|nr:FG-GAP-like repeat-containing protein [bacterium]HQO33845.1 FG-GAP-like repeat-containing protein [bacterium]HQP98365.1 FG-GAP-like repeat-containing protein [bacterium]
MRLHSLLIALFACSMVVTVFALPPFETVVIDSDIKLGYNLTLADIDGDGKQDIVGLAESGPGYVAWYKNPNWQKFRITPETVQSPIDAQVQDIDGDGDLDIAVAHDFQYTDDTPKGAVSWLENTGKWDEPWPVHPIGSEPTLHRIRWIDLDGDKKPELLSAPILGPGSQKPLYIATPIRLEAFTIPNDLSAPSWQERLVDDSLRLDHGLTVLDWDNDDRDDFLTASHEGITLFLNKESGLQRHVLNQGFRSDNGDQGSSEVRRGFLGKNKPFLAAIEPRHGHQLVVYLPPKSGDTWQRVVLDETLKTGHALACGDLDNDGDDEIAAGYRGEGTSLFLYESANPQGTEWVRTPLDEGGIAANSCVFFDFDGDGDQDIACIGGSTNNLKLYVNQMKK